LFEGELLDASSPIYKDCEWHHQATEQLGEVLRRVVLDRDLVMEALRNHTMKTRNRAGVLNSIRDDFPRFEQLVSWLKREDVEAQEKLDACLGPRSEYGFPGVGLFFLTQLLAALHPYDYTVIQDSAVEALHWFGLTDVSIGVSGAKEYLYFNDICRRLYPQFSFQHTFNLSLVHNFLWHYQERYRRNNSGVWWP